MKILNNKTVVITGAASGIGRAAALAFAREGANIIIADVNSASGVEQEVKALGVDAIAFALDVSDPVVYQEFSEKAIAWKGGVDILVNNAGGAGDLLPLVDLTDESFDYSMKLCVYSTF